MAAPTSSTTRWPMITTIALHHYRGRNYGRWPQGELGRLVGYLRTSLLRQASDEEVRLFPLDPCLAPFADLAANTGGCAP